VAAGAAAAQQKILEHVFGGAAARSLIEEARGRLVAALGRVLDDDALRFAETLKAYSGGAGRADALRRAAADVKLRAGEFYGR
jgi:hypothetical protein